MNQYHANSTFWFVAVVDCPRDIFGEAKTNGTDLVVHWPSPEATVPFTSTSSTTMSGEIFKLGLSVVKHVFNGSTQGEVETCTFSVNVQQGIYRTCYTMSWNVLCFQLKLKQTRVLQRSNTHKCFSKYYKVAWADMLACVMLHECLSWYIDASCWVNDLYLWLVFMFYVKCDCNQCIWN